MSSKTETGRAINVANFAQLVSLIPTLGIIYAPPSDILEMSELINSLDLAEESLRVVSANSSSFNAKSIERQTTFAEMPLRATKIINLLAATNAPSALIKDARAVSKKIRGRRATKVAPAVPADGDTSAPSDGRISVSQRSYDQLAQHFQKLVDIAASYSRYTPSESSFTITGLSSYALSLVYLNKEMDDLGSQLFSARFQRDILIYEPETGIYFLAKAVKNYIRSLVGHSDPRYKQVARIKFTLIRKK